APGVMAAAIIVFTFAWSEFLFALILTATPNSQTFPVGVQGLVTQFEIIWNDMAASGAIAMALPLILLVIGGRYIVAALTFGVIRDSLDEDLAPGLRICKEIGSQFLLAIPPRAPDVETRPAIAGTRDALKHAREHAAAMNVRIAFEFLGFADCPINTPALAAETVDGIDGIELVIDASHWYASGADPLGVFPIDRLTLVPANDLPAN